MSKDAPAAVQPDTGQFILRALHASEIAESCPDPELREAFEALTTTWLALAAGEDQPPPA